MQHVSGSPAAVLQNAACEWLACSGVQGAGQPPRVAGPCQAPPFMAPPPPRVRQEDITHASHSVPGSNVNAQWYMHLHQKEGR